MLTYILIAFIPLVLNPSAAPRIHIDPLYNPFTAAYMFPVIVISGTVFLVRHLLKSNHDDQS